MATSAQLRLAAFVAVCRRAGLRLTRQRTEIYRELAKTEEHPDAETIFRRVRRRLPAVSFDTVYRTLRTLEDAGIVARVGPRLDRARFDANMGQHHHFVCTRCGLIRDFESAAFDPLRAPADIGRFGSPESVHVEVRGLCAACRQRGTRPRRKKARAAQGESASA